MGYGLDKSKTICERHVCYPQIKVENHAWFCIPNQKHLDTHSRHSEKHFYTLHTFSPAPNKTADPMVRPCPAAAGSHSNRQLSLPLIQQEDSTVQSDCSKFLLRNEIKLLLFLVLLSCSQWFICRKKRDQVWDEIKWSSKTSRTSSKPFPQKPSRLLDNLKKTGSHKIEFLYKCTRLHWHLRKGIGSAPTNRTDVLHAVATSFQQVSRERDGDFMRFQVPNLSKALPNFIKSHPKQNAELWSLREYTKCIWQWQPGLLHILIHTISLYQPTCSCCDDWHIVQDVGLRQIHRSWRPLVPNSRLSPAAEAISPRVGTCATGCAMGVCGPTCDVHVCMKESVQIQMHKSVLSCSNGFSWSVFMMNVFQMSSASRWKWSLEKHWHCLRRAGAKSAQRRRHPSQKAHDLLEELR